MEEPGYQSVLLARRDLSAGIVEIEIARPQGFDFRPGQHVRVSVAGQERDYSMVSGPSESKLKFCLRRVGRGQVAPFLASAPAGTVLRFTGPHGHFTFRPSGRPPVFVATGTGIAPFVSMARSGVRVSHLIHGVREPADLCYREVFEQAGSHWVPCLSGGAPIRVPEGSFRGRVGVYVEQALPRTVYDFYLCGRREMVRDVTALVDLCFPGSRVFSETFF